MKKLIPLIILLASCSTPKPETFIVRVSIECETGKPGVYTHDYKELVITTADTSATNLWKIAKPDSTCTLEIEEVLQSPGFDR